jgi:hypothetical protein
MTCIFSLTLFNRSMVAKRFFRYSSNLEVSID